MDKQVIQQNQTEIHLEALVSTALTQSKLSGLSEMLKCIAESAEADGAVLWEVTPGARLEGDSPSGHLFILSQWFKEERLSAYYKLPIAHSITGETVISQKAICIENIWEDERVYKARPFLREAGIKTICYLPLTLLDGTRGAVNLYRNLQKPFAKERIRQIKKQVSLIPALYQSIRNKVGFNLVRNVNELVHEAEFRAPGTYPSKDDMKKFFEKICDLVAETYQCIETSIFLEDPLETPEEYKLMATTFPPEYLTKVSYEKDPKDGLIGWVLAHAEPVRIFDLVYFESDKELACQQYPDISCTDYAEIKTCAHAFFGVESDEELPPLSFMAVPITLGEKVLGAICCCIVRTGPSYFAERELNLLKLVAAPIGQYWSNWLNWRRMLEEIRVWRDLVESISAMNKFVRGELSQQAPSEHRIFAQALKVVSSVISGAEIMDVRLLDQKTNELYFAEMYAKSRDADIQEEIQKGQRCRDSVGEETPKSAGAYVFQTDELYVIPDVSEDPYYSVTFPSTKSMIIAPIKVRDQVFGVLDIRGTKKSAFSQQDEVIAMLLGRQLGLYHYLATTIAKLRQTEVELKNRVKEQTQAFEDLEHQLKSPIIQTYARGHAILRGGLSEEKIQYNLKAIRGLCGKAKRVTGSIGLFAALARGKQIQINPSRLEYEDLVKMLIEVAADNQAIIDPERNIRFVVDRKSFEVVIRNKVEVDHDLLDQAANTVLDNAGKYSFSGTPVRISGGLTGTGRFQISFVSKGLRIRPDEVKRCVERGWRGGEAQLATGEGSGIGLWIVDHIMRAHGGELIVVPTTNKGLTEIKLVFPCSRG